MEPTYFHERERIYKSIEHKQAGGMEFHITYADQSVDTGVFNIHIIPRSFTIDGSWQIRDVLVRIGFEPKPNCPISSDCFYKSYSMPKREIDMETWSNNAPYKKYKWLIENLPGLWQEIKLINSKLVGQGLMFPWQKNDFPPDDFTSVPKTAWLGKFKSQEQLDLESKRDMYQERILVLETIMGVLFESGKPLEESVTTLFRDLQEGIEPESLDTVEKGAPIDMKVLLPRSQGSQSFAFEITGTKSGVRKADKKVEDIIIYMTLHRDKENDEKVVLLANTYCEQDPDERGNLHFSREVLEPLQQQGVLLMTTVQLYEIWRGVKEGGLSLQEVVENLYDQVGIYKKDEPH